MKTEKKIKLLTKRQRRDRVLLGILYRFMAAFKKGNKVCPYGMWKCRTCGNEWKRKVS